MNPIKKLIKEYKKTRRNVHSQVQEVSVQIEATKVEMRKLANDLSMAKVTENDVLILQIRDEIINKKMELRGLKEIKKTLSSDISNLNYAIEWMQTARCPGSTRGIEHRSAYERNVKFNGEWIKHQSYQDHDKEELSEDILKENEINQRQKRKFAKSILSTLTDRQKEVIELVANGHSQPEIALLLGVSQQAVSQTIQRCLNKIKDEGWIML